MLAHARNYGIRKLVFHKVADEARAAPPFYRLGFDFISGRDVGGLPFASLGHSHEPLPSHALDRAVFASPDVLSFGWDQHEYAV